MVIEQKYPISFRQAEISKLSEYLGQNTSVALVGMKRVGISNFLRFFLSNRKVALDPEKQLLISVDLNDLVERELYPFWVLLLKRLIDAIDASNLSETIKKDARKLFTESIQLKELFFAVDSVQKILELIVNADRSPVLFLLRFDRLKDVISPEFYGNLQRLKDVSHHRLSFVFTSYRSLYELAPEVITKTSLATFAQSMYLKPASANDMSVIFETLRERYNLEVSETIRSEIIRLSGGHVQYLQIALIKLHEEKTLLTTPKELFGILSQTEEMTLQSEELFASLTQIERDVLSEIVHSEAVAQDERDRASYLWKTGLLTEKNEVFSPLFANYVTKQQVGKPNGGDFTKKEHALLTFLQTREGELCEREDIIEAVWPEQSESGVSDWAVDRLVARVRAKLKVQNSPYEIITVITRGYKLTKKS